MAANMVAVTGAQGSGWEARDDMWGTGRYAMVSPLANPKWSTSNMIDNRWRIGGFIFAGLQLHIRGGSMCSRQKFAEQSEVGQLGCRKSDKKKPANENG